MTFLTREQITSTLTMSSRQAARSLGVGKTSVNKYRKVYMAGGGDEPKHREARILTLDIESRPLLSYHWGLWQQNIGISQIVEHGGMMCFVAKWLGEEDVIFYSDFADGHEKMVRAIHSLLSEADIVVTYNGDRYDVKRLNNEFLKLNMAPPKPFKSIDLYKTNKTKFDLPSKKLDYIAQQVGVGGKLENGGFQLWIDCMAGKPEAWALMEEYNVQDVVLTENLYLKLLPWLTNVPHYGMFTTRDGLVCPYCGSGTLLEDGTTQTHVNSYVLYSCQDCDGWSRGNKPVESAQFKTRKIVG